MALADLIRGVPGPVATATGATAATEPARPASTTPGPVASVAGVAVAKPADVLSARWLLHFDGPDPVVVTADPPLRHADVLGLYPTAIAAEPVSAPLPLAPPAVIVEMFARCVEAGLYDESDRAILSAMHADDSAGRQALIEAMHARIGRCHRCAHFARPGLSDGYCTGRDDLPVAYGFMRHLPPAGGALCETFKE